MKKTLLILGASLTIAVPTFVAAEGLVFSDKEAANPVNALYQPAVVQPDGSQSSYGDCIGKGGRGNGMGRGEMGMQQGRGQGKMGMRQGQGGNFEERKTDLLTFAEKYTPDAVKEWTAVIAEREGLKEKWLSEEYQAARQSYQEERQAMMQELRDQVANGEMTRVDMQQKMMEIKGISENRGLYNDLQAAIDAENKEEAAKLLDELLKQFKERNNELKNRLDSVK